MSPEELIRAASRPHRLHYSILSTEDPDELEEPSQLPDNHFLESSRGPELQMHRHESISLYWSLDNLFHYTAKFKLLRGGRWILGLGINHEAMIMCCWDLHHHVAGEDLHAASELVWGVDIEPGLCYPDFEVQYYDEEVVNCLLFYPTGSDLDYTEKDIVEVVQLRFMDGTPTLERRASIDKGISAEHSHQMLYGNFLCMDHRGKAVVRNWKTGQELLLHEYSNPRIYPTTLIHGAMAWVLTSPDGKDPGRFSLHDISNLPRSPPISQADSLSSFRLPLTEKHLDDSSSHFTPTFQPVDGWLPARCDPIDTIFETGSSTTTFTLDHTSGSYDVSTHSRYERDPEASVKVSVQLRPGSFIEIWPSEASRPFTDDMDSEPERGLLVSRNGTVKPFQFDIQYRHRVVPNDFDPLSGVVLCRPDPDAYGLEWDYYYHEWGNPSLWKPRPSVQASDDDDGLSSGSASGGSWEGGEDEEAFAADSDEDLDSDMESDTRRARKERKGRPNVIVCQLSYLID